MAMAVEVVVVKAMAARRRRRVKEVKSKKRVAKNMTITSHTKATWLSLFFFSSFFFSFFFFFFFSLSSFLLFILQDLALSRAFFLRTMLVLFETPAGYALFKVKNDGKLGDVDNLYKEFETADKANKMSVHSLLLPGF